MSEIVVAGGRSVRARDGLAFNFSRERDVLASGETESVLRVGKTEAVESSVMRDGDLLDKGEVAPFLSVQHWLSSYRQIEKFVDDELDAVLITDDFLEYLRVCLTLKRYHVPRMMPPQRTMEEPEGEDRKVGS